MGWFMQNNVKSSHDHTQGWLPGGPRLVPGDAENSYTTAGNEEKAFAERHALQLGQRWALCPAAARVPQASASR